MRSRLLLGLALTLTITGGSGSAHRNGDRQVTWEFRTEQHWLASVAAETVVHLVAAPVTARPARVDVTFEPRDARAPSRFQIAIDDRQTDAFVELSHASGIWSPETYRAAVRHVRPSTWALDATPADATLLERLTDGQPATIARAARELSVHLTAHPRSPSLHESAALVLTALAFREAGADFHDPRVALVRAAVHLAIADELRGAATGVSGTSLAGKPSHAGRIARAALFALGGRQVDALEICRELRAEEHAPPVASWLRAIEIRVRLDWRILAEPARATLLERLQHVRALQARLDNGAARAFINEHDAGRVPDWARVLLSGRDFSLDDGHQFSREAIELELAEAASVYEIAHGGPLAPGAVVAALNADRPRGPRRQSGASWRLEVIDWPLWADALQRHLAHALLHRSRLLSKLRSGGQAAAAFESEAAQRFKGLRLFPLLHSLWVDSGPDFQAAMVDLLPFWKEPERIPLQAWITTFERRTVSRVATPMGPAAEWFSPAVPVGTVPEDVYMRTHAELGQPVAERIADMAHWRRSAPYRRTLAVDSLTLQYGRQIPPDVIRRELAAFLDFDARSLHRLAEANEQDPAVREDAYRRLCALVVDQCDYLAWRLLEDGRDDEAARVFRRWFAESRDRVRTANGSGWLVDYEFDHDRGHEALSIAKTAASTGSYTGVAVLASLLDRMGHYDEAELFYKQGADRYESPSDLLGFYLRHERQHGGSRFQPQRAALLPKIFPQGMQRVAAREFESRPDATPDGGLIVAAPGRKLRAAGLADGDVIVALDGYRVRNFAQWLTVYSLTRSPELSFVCWRAGRYFPASGRFPGRGIDAKLRDYIQPRGR